MKKDVYVAGVSIVPPTKPSASEPYLQVAAKAVNAAPYEVGMTATALQHNHGLGSACVVTMYKRTTA